jgi:hypothetical protein
MAQRPDHPVAEQAEAIDVTADPAHGPHRTGYELPEEMVRRRSRLAKIQEAMRRTDADTWFDKGSPNKPASSYRIAAPSASAIGALSYTA